jgi:hypothetical protein
MTSFVMLNEVKHLAIEKEGLIVTEVTHDARPRSFASLRMTS